MKHPWLAVLSLLPFSMLLRPPQEGVRDVPPGREIREQKLLSPGLSDTWKLDVEADEVLWCVVESSAFDPLLELFDAAGERLGSDDGRGTRSELWLEAPRKGPVQFRVQGFGGAGGGHYSFWLQRYRTEALACDGEAQHTFGKEQWWHYRIALREGDILVPTVTGQGRLTAVFDEVRWGVPDDHGGFQARRTGDHYLRIEGAEGRTCGIATQLARQRDLGETKVDDVVPAQGFDVFHLRNLEPGSAWVLDLAMPAAQLEFDLREAPEPAFAWPGHLDKGGRRLRWLLVRRDGTITVLLRNRGSAPAPFRLARTPQLAVLQSGAPVAGKLALGEGDLRELRLEAGDLLRLRLTSCAFDARFDVWDPDGNVIAQGIDDRGPLDRDAEHTLLVPRSGCYRVLAYGNGGAGSGDYTLAADVLPVPDLQIGARLGLRLAEGGTSHVHMHLQAGQEVWLSVRSRAFDAGLVVLAPDGNAAFRGEGGGRGRCVLTAFVAAHTGVHTLLVQSRGGAGDCELRALEP